MTRSKSQLLEGELELLPPPQPTRAPRHTPRTDSQEAVSLGSR